MDLGWYGKPSGLASIIWNNAGLQPGTVTRLEDTGEMVDWIQRETGNGNSVVAVDAPLVIRNRTGMRPAERELNRDFRRFHAGCHPVNLSRPFAAHVLSFSRRLAALGFVHGAEMNARRHGRFQVEVHPHAASVNLFDLDRIVKYKRGLRNQRARELGRLRRLMLGQVPLCEPAFSPRLPPVPAQGTLKPVEDQIDAVLCAYIAAHWWFWGRERNRVYGTSDEGYVIVPCRRVQPDKKSRNDFPAGEY